MRYLTALRRSDIFARVLLFCSLLVAAGVTPPVAAEVFPFQLTVVSNQTDHHSWAAASHLAEVAAGQGLKIKPALAVRSGGQNSHAVSAPELLVMPLRSLATQVPALEVLELPFLFSDIESIHQAFADELGDLLREQTRQRGWELLALWDEGMQMLSGNRRYDRVINLTGMEFILLRPDPVAEKQFHAFDAWSRSARPQTREQLLRECMIGSRAATLSRLWHERLDRVHLALSLSTHRYEGWVVIAPLTSWNRRSEQERARLRKALSAMRDWQRADARQREKEALQQFETAGMQIYRLRAEQREEFAKRLPAWETLLSDSVPLALRKKLVAAATAGVSRGASAHKASLQAKPATPARQSDDSPGRERIHQRAGREP